MFCLCASSSSLTSRGAARNSVMRLAHNGQAAQICTVNVSDVAGKNVVTIEGLAKNGTLHPVQQAWLDEDVAQCGFCQPGQIMQAAAMLKTNKAPTDADIDQIMNVCRCGTYCRIRAAIKRAARPS